MKKLIAVILALILVFSLAACGGSDALMGTWTGEDTDTGTIVWTFNGGGKCTYKNDFFESDGTYVITDNKVTVNIEMWDDEKIYDFTVTDNNLKLDATDPLSPSYDLTKK